MLNKLRKWFKTVVDDRLLVLLVPSLVIISSDTSIATTFLYAVSICVALVGIAHWMRLVLFPHFDGERLFSLIALSPIAAAITIASMALTTIFFVSVLMVWMTH